MIQYDKEYVNTHSEEFFHTPRKNGEISSFSKEDIYASIDNDNIETVYPWCEYFDIPFIENEWFRKVIREKERGNDRVFGKYLAFMNLKSFKNWGWANTDELNKMYEEKENG